MREAALLPKPSPVLPPPAAAPAVSAGARLVQAKSGLGGGGAMMAPPITDAGRPLDAATRQSMESGFGQDFSHVRVHDDARAHDHARELNARAYAAGDHIVFGEGHYRPETAMGRALIAHELAHTVQQGGVQMKADGPLPAAADAELEGQADRAAAAVTAGRAAPALSRIGAPAVFRAAGDEPAPGGATQPVVAGPQPIPTNWELIDPKPNVDNPMSATFSVKDFKLPEVKGPGSWVKEAYDAHASTNRLAFMPIFSGPSREPTESVAAYKEGDEKYKTIWLGKFGFKSLKDLATAFETTAKTDPSVAQIWSHAKAGPILHGFKAKNTLTAGSCDIDHIVEKQLQGSSQRENLQLLGSSKNQTSGTNTYAELKALVRRLDGTKYGKVATLRLQFPVIGIKPDTEADDGSFVIEQALRAGKVHGSDKIAQDQKGSPVALSAGSAPEIVTIAASGETPLDIDSKRLIPGMKLQTYTRAKNKGDDTITAVFDHKVMKPAGQSAKGITLLAKKQDAPAPATAAVPAPDAAADTAPTPAGIEQRTILLKPLDKGSALGFYYPYLSPGEVTKLSLDSTGRMSGEGVIHPTPKFLGDLKIKFGPETLELNQELNVDTLNSSKLVSPLKNIFRFTSGSAKLDLVNFKPEGELGFTFGAAASPMMKGKLTLAVVESAFAATGDLELGKVPGIKEAKGKIAYNSKTGLSGELVASSATFGGGSTSVTAKLGFSEVGGRFQPYASGAITTQVKGASLTMGAHWNGAGIEYKVKGKIPKPLPMVNSIDLDGTYRTGKLSVTGKTALDWKKFGTLDLTLTYTHLEGEDEGHFSGIGISKATVNKAELDVEVGFAEDGKWWASGSIAYPITPDIKPKLKLSRDKSGKIMIGGEVTLAPIALTKKWPKPEGGNITFIKGVGVKFPVPTPVPGATVFGEVTASAGFNYGVGPVMLNNIKFNGSLYPFEDDPQIEAALTITPDLPAYAEVYGKFGANIGAELAGGAVGVKGGVSLKPAIRLAGNLTTPFTANYKDHAFSFELTPKAKASLSLTLDIDLNAEVYAAYGVFSHVWTYHLETYKWDLGGDIVLSMGRLAYDKTGVTFPSLSDVKVEPEIDPIGFIKKNLGENTEKKREPSQAERDAYSARMRTPMFDAGKI